MQLQYEKYWKNKLSYPIGNSKFSWQALGGGPSQWLPLMGLSPQQCLPDSVFNGISMPFEDRAVQVGFYLGLMLPLSICFYDILSGKDGKLWVLLSFCFYFCKSPWGNPQDIERHDIHQDHKYFFKNIINIHLIYRGKKGSLWALLLIAQPPSHLTRLL